ncbi:MAG: hypothetical protein EOO07_25655 [Chitinophagaceae bacterium]|nr:MAG: hypothetical protein EOO07_25655 [Chitinophagaceae bacterium]
MKNIIFVLLSLFFANELSASDVTTSDTSKSYSIKLAQADIGKGKIKFLIMGGFAPKHYEGKRFSKRSTRLNIISLDAFCQNLFR